MTLRVLTLSTLFPDATRPNFGVFVERQTCALASRPGVDVTVLAPLGLPPWPVSLHAAYRARRALPAEEQWQGLTVHRPRFPIVPAIGGRWHPALMTRAILPLVRRLHAARPFDVIDASFFFPDGPVARRLSRQLGIPYSVKARGADIHHWGRDPATAAMVREAGRDAAGLLAVSAAMKADMVALGMEPDRIRVHYTGVDQARFTLADRASAKAAHGLSGPVVTVLGALIPRKGQALVIEALAGLADVTLLLIGDGPDRAALSTLAGRLGMAARVRFLGSVPHGDLPGWLAASDIMALPSASEGLANAWVEALACGVPLVISEAGGARELLDRPEAGRIVPREPEAIRQAIASLLATPPDPAAVRATAERFSWDANGAALEAHLRACAGKTAGE
ncbi:putative glycosyltransferase [Sphingobium sp. SYK-6]|uniref:glycosyltransferase n=1 Tax=Sphingobium sp. (strain NBRC 103272 / SYK-6) TaxID=627192 RepID=UPI0002277307|nr:glycosyltransferase [Sphingobium sp. SYK-6]BAK67646.1 putative glycosyltransferase [Sphingobium sp. SYK-6]